MTKRSNCDTLSDKCLNYSSTKNIERIPKQNDLFSFTNNWKDEVF